MLIVHCNRALAKRADTDPALSASRQIVAALPEFRSLRREALTDLRNSRVFLRLSEFEFVLAAYSAPPHR